MRRLLLMAVATATIAGASSAWGAVTVGDATAPADGRAPGPTTYLQGSGAGSGYVIPGGAGVITSWTESVAADADVSVPVALVVAHWTAPGLYTAAGVSDRSDDPASAGVTQHVHPARIAVEGGDVLGVWIGATPTPAGIATGSAGPDYDLTRISSGQAIPPAPSGWLPAEYSEPGRTLRLAAVVEPDADRDQFGDETQDACPADPYRHTPPCVVDGSLRVVASTKSPVIGSTVRFTATALAPADADLLVASIQLTVPSSLSALPAVTAGGTCGGFGTVACGLGNVPAGGSHVAYFPVLARALGPATVTAVLHHSELDPNAANDTAVVKLTVVRPPCTVPRLKGLTLAGARRRLARAGCRLGTVRRRAGSAKRVRVVGQSIRAGRRVAAGTRVGVVVSRPRGSARARAAAGARRPARLRPR